MFRLYFKSCYNIFSKIKKTFLSIYNIIIRYFPFKIYNPYSKLKLSPSVIKNLMDYNIEIRKPYDYPYLNNYPSKVLKKKYSKYYDKLLDFIRHENTTLVGRKMRDEYWSNYDPFNKSHYIEKFKDVIGYHNIIKPFYEIISTEITQNIMNYQIDDIIMKGRFNTPFHIFRGVPKLDKPKGIVLAIHGRSEYPDYLMGLTKNDTYSRKFGNYWLNNGYIVYAPQVDYDKSLSIVSLNYSNLAVDIAKILDLILYIKSNHDKSLPLISCGISYGAHLSEILGIISDEINAVVSIGGMARGDLFDRLDNDVNKWYKKVGQNNKFQLFSTNFHFLYNSLGIYKLLATKNLVISIGTHDWGEEKFNMIFNTLEYYKRFNCENNIRLNLFYGYHEADPIGEMKALEDIYSKQTV